LPSGAEANNKARLNSDLSARQYSDAMMESKSAANRKVVQMAFRPALKEGREFRPRTHAERLMGSVPLPMAFPLLPVQTMGRQEQSLSVAAPVPNPAPKLRKSSQSRRSCEKLSARLLKRDETETPHEHVAG